MDNKLSIFSIFKSVSGEVSPTIPQGSVCTFIRFAGCNLPEEFDNPCAWCDTRYAQETKSGKIMTISDIVKKVEKIGCNNVIITGGEPLYQKEQFISLCLELLFNHPYILSIETNGTYSYFDDFEGDDVGWVVDWKLKSSNVSYPSTLKLKNILSYPPENTFVKFVVTSKQDFNEAIIAMRKIQKEFHYQGTEYNPRFAFSPAWDVQPIDLYNWMKERKALNDSILNVQLHKVFKFNEEK